MDDPKTVVKEFFDALNLRDYQRVTELVHDNFHHSERRAEASEIQETAYPQPFYPRDRDYQKKEFIDGLRMWDIAYSGKINTLNQMVSEGSIVCLDIDFEGIHSGNLMGIPATNRKVKIRGIGMIRVEYGKIMSSDIQWDLLSELIQIGRFILDENDSEKVRKYIQTLRDMSLLESNL